MHTRRQTPRAVLALLPALRTRADVLRDFIARRSPINVADFAPGNEVQRR